MSQPAVRYPEDRISYILTTSIASYALRKLTNAHQSLTGMWILPDSVKAIAATVLDLAILGVGVFALAESIVRLGLAILLSPTNLLIACYSSKLACTYLITEWYGVAFSALQFLYAPEAIYQLSPLPI